MFNLCVIVLYELLLMSMRNNTEDMTLLFGPEQKLDISRPTKHILSCLLKL